MYKINDNSLKKAENNNKSKKGNVQSNYNNEAIFKNSSYKNKMLIYQFLKQIIILLSFQNLLKECSQAKAYSSIITIKIKKSGRQNILFGGDSCFGDSKFTTPDEVIINNAKQYYNSIQYDFEETDNIIQLKWHNFSENWGCLFKEYINITEIDFSQFDFTQSIKGNSMFYGCKSLTTLNLNDFGTVKLKDAGSLFRDMTSLISLNLSNFDFSEVTDIGCLFNGCRSLTSLDLSNVQFDNTNIYTYKLFWDCFSLGYVNLKQVYFNPNNMLSSKKKILFFVI